MHSLKNREANAYFVEKGAFFVILILCVCDTFAVFFLKEAPVLQMGELWKSLSLLLHLFLSAVCFFFLSCFLYATAKGLVLTCWLF